MTTLDGVEPLPGDGLAREERTPLPLPAPGRPARLPARLPLPRSLTPELEPPLGIASNCSALTSATDSIIASMSSCAVWYRSSFSGDSALRKKASSAAGTGAPWRLELTAGTCCVSDAVSALRTVFAPNGELPVRQK